ncbi:MAG TPA: CvpA family protein [Chitinophagaceae bacterium]|nr:CvpA family protein [Chitinophagaceae bacterium]
MILDIIFLIVVIIAIIKGYRRGLIVGVFSFLALIIGLAAAMKLSTIVAGYIGKAVKISDQWLPLIAFILIFLIVVLLVRAVAAFIEKSVQFVMLGWLNRLGGIIFYVALYITIYSVVLFYAEQMKLVQNITTVKSLTYSYVQPWGPKAINSFGAIVPAFKNMFSDLQHFFGNLSHNMS